MTNVKQKSKAVGKPKSKYKHYNNMNETKKLPNQISHCGNNNMKTNRIQSKEELFSNSAVDQKLNILPWPSPNCTCTSLDTELSLIPLLIEKKNETGMIKSKSSSRINRIISHCKSNSTPLLQALSLRRHHVWRIHSLLEYKKQKMGMKKTKKKPLQRESIGLGSDRDIKQAATIFEKCIETYLHSQNITFLTEEDQKSKFNEERKKQLALLRKQIKKNRENICINNLSWNKTPPTPDFIFEQPVCLRLYLSVTTHSPRLVFPPNNHTSNKTLSGKNKRKREKKGTDDKDENIHILNKIQSNKKKHKARKKGRNDEDDSEEHPLLVNWLEAKNFYGASSIPLDGKSAVGNLLSTAERYVQRYGPGMMVFAYGCGNELSSKLKAKGVIALDASPCDLTNLENQQKTWCADKLGRILF